VFFQTKPRDPFAPTGPFLVTTDEIEDPQALPVKLTVNGDAMQNRNPTIWPIKSRYASSDSAQSTR